MIIPFDRFFIHNQRPILDLHNWVDEQQDRLRTENLIETSTSAWWFKITTNDQKESNKSYLKSTTTAAKDTFLFRARTGKLRTNSFLYKLKDRLAISIPDDQCHLCKNQQETIKHMLECDASAYRKVEAKSSQAIRQLTGTNLLRPHLLR